MFGGSGKSGRGGRGGGGGGKRNLHSNFHSTSINRPSGGRPSVAGSSAPRNSRSTSTTGVSTVAAPSVAAEETFSLVTGNPLDFAMIIRLAPDLVDEIKRVEAQGTSARIKFDANANNSSGNVIDVGGKEFRFTWSKEMGDLCDIYEERRSGEDGNGLLVESGCAWRKLNVQRVLDESTKNHVKMRSEEAERKSKSRKAIILDHGNPSMKSQMKALAAAEANPWKMPFKQKKEPPYKKRKAEPPPGPPKSAQKHGFSLTTPSRGRTSASPLPSTPEQPHASASPFGPGSLCKGHASVEDNMPTQATNKEKALSSEKGTPNRVNTTAVLDKAGRKGNLGAKPTDLRSTLISLLMDNPKGMSLKALEKSVGENFPNSGRQIEPIIKKIATYQAPGRYFLKSGTELESLKKPLSESGSSENNQQQTPGPGDNRDDVRDPEQSVSMKTHITENDVQTHSNSEPGEVIVVEKGNVPLHSPDPYAEKKVSENINGPVATSSGSDSESDSESDSSDSGSDSGSHSRGRSKSRSPVGSGSGSSSDSESDASSNSKEGSDVEVDIMTSDDDKELKGKLQAPEPESSTSPLRPDGLLVHDLSNEKENFYASEVVENMKNSPGYAQVTETVSFGDPISNKEGEMHPQLTKPSADWSLPQERQMHTEHLQGEREKTAKDGFKHDRYQRKSEGKSKRRSEGKHFDDNAERSKKVKAGVTEAPMSEDSNLLLSRSPGKNSPGRPNEGSYRGLNTQITEKAAKDRTDFGLHRAYNQLHPSKALSDSLQSGPRPVDLSARTKAPANNRPGKYAENLGVGVKSTERSFQTPEGFPMQKDKVYREIHSEDGYNNERRPPRNPREGVADKNSTPADSHYKKRGEFAGTFNEVGSVSNSQIGYPPKDNSRSDMDRSPIINGRGPILRREPSELELGELRDPLPEETPGIKKQFDRKGSFKQSENKLSSSDYWNPDLSKVKPAARTGMDSVRPFSPHLNVGVRSNPDGSSKKKKSPESYGEDSTKSRYRVVQPQTSQLPRVEEAEVGSQINNLADVNIKNGQIEAVASQGIGLEGYGDTHRKVPKVTSQPHDTVQGRVAHSTRESKRRKTNTSAEFNDKCEEPPLMDIRDGGKKKRGSFTDDSSFIYSKYEKDKPELKGPIKDHSQYMEYVQEYREKYDSYISINKILESERNEFIKFGRDLESAKGKDMNRYNSILEQLRESYRQRGMRHKRLKKVFVVLHEELKSLKETIREYASSYAKD